MKSSFYVQAVLIEVAKIILILLFVALCLAIFASFEFGLASGKKITLLIHFFQSNTLPSLLSLPYAVLSSSAIDKSSGMEKRFRWMLHPSIFLVFLLLYSFVVELGDFNFALLANKQIGFVILNYALFIIFLTTWIVVQWIIGRSQPR